MDFETIQDFEIGVRRITVASASPPARFPGIALGLSRPSRLAWATAQVREVPRPSLKVFLKSLGRSTGGDAVQAIFINDGNVPVKLIPGEVFTIEPLADVTEQQLARELAQFAGKQPVTVNLTAYCLNFRKSPPRAGQIFGVAPLVAQAESGPVRRILNAAERLRSAGRLTPDSDAVQYFHSIRQWAIWTREQGFNERSFGDALLEHTRKNVVAAGRRWDKQLEQAARNIIPNRWRDVQEVLAEAQRGVPAAR